MGLAGNAVDQRKGDQVRQVADGGEGRVMRIGRHLHDLATQARPEVHGLADGDALLEDGGWEELQCYLFSRPVIADEITDLQNFGEKVCSISE